MVRRPPPLLLAESVALFWSGVPYEHRIPGSGEPGGGPPSRGGSRVLAAVAAALGDGDGTPDPDALGDG